MTAMAANSNKLFCSGGDGASRSLSAFISSFMNKRRVALPLDKIPDLWYNLPYIEGVIPRRLYAQAARTKSTSCLMAGLVFKE